MPLSEQTRRGSEHQPATASSYSPAWILKAVAAGIIAVALGGNLWLQGSFPELSWAGYGSKSIDWDSRRRDVKEAFISSWNAYSKYAWGQLLKIYAS